MPDPNVVATAIARRVRTMDVGERHLTAVWRTRPERAGAVISRLISMIQPPEGQQAERAGENGCS